jgi:LEA14-like dessication related protein
VELRGIHSKLLINGTSFAQGLSDEHLRIPASGTVTVRVPVYATMFNLVGSMIDLLQRPATAPVRPVQYELAGKLLLGSTGQEEIPFVLQGRFPSEAP